MADSILRLKVDSQEYDAKIKRASQGLQQYVDGCRKAGGTLEVVEKETLKFVQELGKMDTVAKTAKGRIGEMSSAFIELSRVEKQLTDQERQSPVGKALAESLQQLKQRTIEAKQELEGLNSQISGKLPSMGDGGSALDNAMSGLTGKFAMGNLYAEAAMKGVEAMESLGQKVVEVTQKGMQLSVAAEGIEIAFNRLNQPGLLDQLRQETHGTVSDLELMKAAVKFDDFKLPVEELGTMLAFAQKKAKDTGQSIDYLVESIVNGLGRQSTMILDNLGLSQAEVKARTKETGDMTTAVGQIIREQMEAAGEYTETASDRIARANAENENALKALGDQMRETFGDRSWEELSIGLETELAKSLTDVARGIETITTFAGLADSAFFKWLTSASSLMEGLKLAIEGALGPLGSMLSMLETIGQKSFRGTMVDFIADKVNNIAGDVLKAIGTNRRSSITTPTSGNKGRGGKGGGKTEVVYPEGSIGQLNQELQKLKKAQDLATDPEAWNSYQVKIDEVNEKIKALKSTYTEAAEAAKKLAEYTKAQEEYDKALSSGNFSDILKTQEALSKLRGSVNLPDGNGVMVMGNMKTGISEAFKNSNMSSGSINGFISAIKSELDKADFGSQVFDKLTEKMKDATMISNVMKELIANGVNGADLEEVGALLKEKILKGEIPDSVWEELQEQINAKLAELGIDPIKIDFKTGGVKKVEKDANNMTKDWQKTASAISAVGSAMSQIENPAAKVMGTLAQAVATVALGYAQATKDASSMGPWAWIAFAATGLATMITTISTIKSTAKFSEGGIIQGNSYSGDNILGHVNGGGFVGLNAQEIVLNKAQQGNLATQLSDNALNGGSSTPYVMGEQIYLGLNTYLKRKGQGELVTSKR